jgi:hypothetical protein
MLGASLPITKVHALYFLSLFNTSNFPGSEISREEKSQFLSTFIHHARI